MQTNFYKCCCWELYSITAQIHRKSTYHDHYDDKQNKQEHNKFLHEKQKNTIIR